MSIIKTHQRRCKAAGKRPAFLVEAPPQADSPPAEWAFDGLARWHTWPLLPLKHVHDVQGNHRLLVYLPGRANALECAGILEQDTTVIMDTGHSDLLHFKPYAARPPGFEWWHVVGELGDQRSRGRHAGHAQCPRSAARGSERASGAGADAVVCIAMIAHTGRLWALTADGLKDKAMPI